MQTESVAKQHCTIIPPFLATSELVVGGRALVLAASLLTGGASRELAITLHDFSMRAFERKGNDQSPSLLQLDLSGQESVMEQRAPGQRRGRRPLTSRAGRYGP